MQLENRDFFCTSEWHFAKLGKYEGLVYAHALHVTSAKPNDRRYFPAIHKIAAYYAADPKTIRKAIHKLVKLGFFVVLRDEPGKPTSYRPVLHKEWAARFPGRCLVRLEMPWDGEPKDPLVIRLHAASDGRLRLHTGFVKGLRNTKHCDDAIVEHWKSFYGVESPEGDEWYGIYGRFRKYLLSQQTNCQ